MKRKITKKQKGKIISVLVTTIILVVALVCGVINKEELFEILGIEPAQVVASTAEEQDVHNGTYQVTEVVDGDTFKIVIDGKTQKVRLIGMDTPESVSPDQSKNSEYGVKAFNYTKGLIEGKMVTLEFDVEKTDKYNRLLAYVYLEDGTMLNKKLLEEGYAKLATYPPNVKYVDEFKAIQKEARKENRGFWAENVFK